MTAPITDLEDRFYSVRPEEGDSETITISEEGYERPAGTLWERLRDRTNMSSPHAVSVVNSPAYTSRLADATNRALRRARLRRANQDARHAQSYSNEESVGQ